MARRRAWLLMICVVMLPALGRLGTAGAQAGAPVGTNPWVTLLPALRTAPAPSWLRLGMRITYYGASASIPGARHYYYQDPGGEWHDRDGHKFKQGDVPGPAGHGFTQITILGLDPTVVALAWRIFLISGVSGAAAPASNDSGSLEYPGAGGDLWLNPQVLRGATAISTPEVQVAPVPYTINSRRYNALWIHTGPRTASLTSIFDLDCGIQLHSSSATQGPPLEGKRPQGESNEGSTVLAQSTLVDVRTPNVPWALEPSPEWVGRVNVLRYQGSITHYIPVAGASPVSLPFSLMFQRQRVGTNWAQYVATVVQPSTSGLPSTPAQTIRLFGSAQYGGLWIPPRGLDQLRPGQVLDTDPETKVTVTVGQAGRSPQGADVIVITEANESFHSDSVYDRSSGMLLYANVVDNILSNRTQIQLVQRQ